MRFVSEPAWRVAEILQDLLGGDALRTGPAGALALRFADQTLIRMHHNSSLLVKDVSGAEAANLLLNGGRIWARASKAQSGVNVETPSATVAIRGTDWSLSVDGSRTTLVVIEGVVVMSNGQGSVTVRKGEAAVAEIGRAPAKIVLTQPPGREQALYYMSLRSAFNGIRLAPVSSRQARDRYAELEQIPPENRNADQWLEIAELALPIAGRDMASKALEHAKAISGFSRVAAARADMVEGILAARARQWDKASALFGAAIPALSGDRKYIALVSRYLSLALGGRRQEAMALQPQLARYRGSRWSVIAEAYIRGNLGELEGAFSDLKSALRKWSRDVDMTVLAAQIAILLGKEKEARQLAAKAMALDPDDPDAINTQATILSDYDFDPDRAVELLERATKTTPGNADVWNTLGLARSDQGDNGGAAKAFTTAIALDPDDPVAYANYSILLLDADKLDSAKRQISRVNELDPSFYYGLLAEGRWLAQQGRLKEARDKFLDAVAANPLLSNSSLALAIAQYQMGDLLSAKQSLAAASNLDPADPLVPLVETVIALDRAEADEAIISARETYKRFRARGGANNPLAASREGGSYLNAAFGELSLDDWGRFYGDLSFSPFDAASQFFQAVAPRVKLYENGSVSETAGIDAGALIQGLLIDPLSVSSRNRYTDLFRRPFADVTVGSGVVLDRDGEIGWNTEAELQAFANPGLPIGLYANVTRVEADFSALDTTNDDWSASGFLGSNLSLTDHLLLFGTYNKLEDAVPDANTLFGGEDRLNAKAFSLGAGYSHSFGPRNLGLAAVAFTRSETDQISFAPGDPLSFLTAREHEKAVYFGLAHYFDKSRVTFRYGAEGQAFDQEASSELVLGGFSIPLIDETGNGLRGRIFGDALFRAKDNLAFEGGLHLTRFDDGDGDRGVHLDPRIGAAWLAMDGHWLRTAYREDTLISTITTLAPVTTAGITPGLTPIDDGGRVNSVTLRWDAEWSDRFFTAIELEHQDIRSYSISLRDTFDFAGDVDEGRIDRASLFANAWLGYGIGAFGELTLAQSENTSGDANDGEALPLVPKWRGRFGFTWVHPSQLRVTVAENLIGERAGDVSGAKLDAAATTDIEVSWQPFDKRLELGASMLNIFDEDHELATGIRAPGATFLLRGELRF
jgi:Tfp pilus assembly protein PilF